MLKQFFDHLIEFLDHVRIERNKFAVSDAVTVVRETIFQNLQHGVFNECGKLTGGQSNIEHMEKILDPYAMTTPGISAKELLDRK